MNDEPGAADRRCPQCGGELFRAVPRKTTEREIADYKGRKTMKIGPITWDPQWIPNGLYCYSCEWFDERRIQPMQKNRVYGAVRTALIGYGVAAFMYFQVDASSGAASQALGDWGSARGFVLMGIGLQLTLLLARALARRYVADAALATQIMGVCEIVADGVTVLLFAIATLGPITRLPSEASSTCETRAVAGPSRPGALPGRSGRAVARAAAGGRKRAAG
jgi:hypothetical protein